MKTPLASVLATRRTWTGICAVLIDYTHSLFEERDPSGIVDEELETSIRDHVQKIIPVIYHAADKIEWPELEELYKDMVRESGYVVPENYEDIGKTWVHFVNAE